MRQCCLGLTKQLSDLRVIQGLLVSIALYRRHHEKNYPFYISRSINDGIR